MRGDFTNDDNSNNEPTQDDDDAPPGNTTDSALAAFGLAPLQVVAPERVRLEVFHLLPEAVPAFNLWGELQSQWSTGLMGRTGLDYAGVEAHLRLSGRPRSSWAGLHAQLRIMERAALLHWADERQREQASSSRRR